MTKLVGKETNNDPVPVDTAFNFGHYGMAAVDPDHIIIGLGRIRVVWLPYRLHTNTSGIMVSFALRGSHLLQPACKEPGGEKLLVGDLTALFVHEL